MGRESPVSPNPNPLTDPILPALKSIAVVTAVRTGLLEAIGSGSASAKHIAMQTGLDADGVERLADALTACGHLAASGGGYSLTPVTRETLVRGGRMQLENWARFSSIQLEAAFLLPRVLRTGKPVDLYHLMESEEEKLVHQRAMAETAVPIADWIAETVSPPAGSARMLDIGGSHGVYSAALCRRYPPMLSTVYELPEIVKFARRVAGEKGTARFCTYVEEDFMEAVVEDRCDLAFLGNIVHHFDRIGATRLLEKVRACLNPGGLILIWDITGRKTLPDIDSALFSLLFYITSKAGCYSASDIEDMLESAGFENMRGFRPQAPSTHRLTVGVAAGSPSRGDPVSSRPICSSGDLPLPMRM